MNLRTLTEQSFKPRVELVITFGSGKAPQSPLQLSLRDEADNIVRCARGMQEIDPEQVARILFELELASVREEYLNEAHR